MQHHHELSYVESVKNRSSGSKGKQRNPLIEVYFRNQRMGIHIRSDLWYFLPLSLFPHLEPESQWFPSQRFPGKQCMSWNRISEGREDEGNEKKSYKREGIGGEWNPDQIMWCSLSSLMSLFLFFRVITFFFSPPPLLRSLISIPDGPTIKCSFFDKIIRTGVFSELF